MPTTSTIPPALKHLLKRHKTCVLRLSRETKIPRERLVKIYETGNFTGPELHALLAVLDPPLVNYLAAALGWSRAEYVVTRLQLQIGIINQAGKRNKQRNVVNVYVNPAFHVTRVAEPDTKALGGSPQRWEQPPMQPGGVVRQIGPVGTVQELGKAA
jgi:hypothetical protein